MRPKKNPKNDLNSDTGIFFATILLLLLTLTYLTLEWKSYYKSDYSDTYPRVEEGLIEKKHVTQITTKVSATKDPIRSDIHTEEDSILLIQFPAEEAIILGCSLVENYPVFPGCEDEKDTRACFDKMMADHVRNNLQYPETALESYDQGKVVVMLEIQIDGSIAIIKNIGPSRVLEHEAARIIRLLPTMKPAVHQGIPIKVSYSLPINFSQ